MNTPNVSFLETDYKTCPTMMQLMVAVQDCLTEQDFEGVKCLLPVVVVRTYPYVPYSYIKKVRCC